MKKIADSISSTIPSIAALSLAVCQTATAQCPMDWIKTDGFPGGGVEPEVYAVTTWDPDGAGPAAARLVAGGLFRYFADRVVNSIAALNPETGQWGDLAGGLDLESKDPEAPTVATVYALTSFQNDLIAHGSFNLAGVSVPGMARWDGKAWEPMPVPGLVNTFTEYNGELIAAGSFFNNGQISRLTRWDGTSWMPFPPDINGSVTNICVYNGDLVAVGTFNSIGGVAASGIARWDGSQWHALGTGLNSGAFGLAVLGDDLYVGGNFTLAGGVPETKGVARWDGANWLPVGGGLLFAVSDLVTYNGDIVAGGLFTVNLGGQQVQGLARFDTDSQQWVAMEGGFCCGYGMSEFAVQNVDGVDELFVVGFFRKIANTTASGIARWSDVTQSWGRVAPGFNWTPYKFTTYRGDLIAGGFFESAGDSNARGVARWDGATWHELEGGSITSVSHIVNALDVYNDELIIAGHFNSVGGVPAENIAAYNADTGTWHALGSGITPGGTEIAIVNALAVYNGELIAGGQFGEAGGVPCSAIARWNGSQWQPLGVGLGGWAYALTVYSGELIVTGSFFAAGGNTEASGLARWDGANWTAFPPGGQNGTAMTVWNGQLICGFQQPRAWDGSTWSLLPGWSWDPNGAGLQIMGYAVVNDELIVAGMFDDPAGIADSDNLVRFDGTSWSSMATENGTIASITSGIWVHNGDLITNGRIEHGDGTMSNWRRWGPSCPSADLDGDGVVNVFDLLALVAAWGACPPSSCAADLNSDGNVNVIDLLQLIGNWG